MKKRNICKLIFVILLAAGSVPGQSVKAAKIDEFVKRFAAENQFAGVVLAADNGEIIYTKAFGLANAEHKILNQPNTRIGIASITKYMTIVILNRLVEHGKVTPEDKLVRFIPDFPAGDKITIDMLARHRSGIPHRVMPPEAESVGYSSAEFVDKVKTAKLAFEPGTQRLYSSAAYSVLARCLEIASGKSYAELLGEYVFEPAGMTDSLDFNGETVIDHRAQDYYLSPSGLVNVPLKDYSFLVGAGSVYSTAGDVYRFGTAVLDGKFGEPTKNTLVGQANLSGSGSTNGHRAYFEIERNKKYGFVVLSNLGGVFDVVSQGIKDILEGKEVRVPQVTVPKIIPNPNSDLSEYPGRYKRADGSETTVIVRNGSLWSADIRLYPIRPDCFFEYRFFGEACFTRDGAGKITDLRWKGFNFDLVWVRQ